MKRWICIVTVFLAILSLAGCGTSENTFNRIGNQAPVTNEVLEADIAKEVGNAAQSDGQPADTGAASATNISPSGGKESTAAAPLTEAMEYTDSLELPVDSEPQQDTAGEAMSVDVDLTVLSRTMVYSEVYNMMVSPEEYVGKTVKMSGAFTYYHDEASDQYYYACIIRDATACSAQGIEFALTDDYSYPEDYPELDEDICVIGRFDTYQEGSNTYCTLRDARIIE